VPPSTASFSASQLLYDNHDLLDFWMSQAGYARRTLARIVISMATIRLSIVFDSGARVGPGKAALLESIRDTGSISAAARGMGMSYKRAWLLLDSMNQAFEAALKCRYLRARHDETAAESPRRPVSWPESHLGIIRLFFELRQPLELVERARQAALFPNPDVW
jgi:hypothetical protein